MIFTKNSPLEELLSGSTILMDKPLKWSSFDVVKKVKYTLSKYFNIKHRNIKVGHAGTLDPLAQGLLVLCTGKNTKQIESIQNEKKTYTGTMVLGASTPSFDLETPINQTISTSNITPTACHEIVQLFLGEIKQYPPAFSAVKVNGKRAYSFARKGIDPKLNPRHITIYNFDINTDYLPNIEFLITCSKGTYIRSLVSDYGKALENAAYLSSLNRIAIGNYTIENAWSITSFCEYLKNKVT